MTHDREVAAFLKLAEQPNVIIATFGDLMRVPGPDGRSLKHAQADGARVSVIYSPLDALTLAADNPDATVVFLGVGFETTAPAVAATVLAAEQRKLDNFAVFSCHKLVPPRLPPCSAIPTTGIDAFLLPGHVSTVLGLSPFRFVAEDWKRPAIVAGFEPADILDALCRMARQYREGEFKVENAYPRRRQRRRQPQGTGHPVAGVPHRRRPLARPRRHPRQRPRAGSGLPAFRRPRPSRPLPA